MLSRAELDVVLEAIADYADGPQLDEVLRVVDSLQLTATHRVSTPVN